MRWVEDVIGQPAFSSVGMRLRSGLDDTPVVYSEKGVGEFGDPFVVEIPGEEYYQLDRLNKGPLVEDEENWSPWKSAENGQLSTAPGPRRYIQFRLILTVGSLTRDRSVDCSLTTYSLPLPIRCVRKFFLVLQRPRRPLRLIMRCC